MDFDGEPKNPSFFTIHFNFFLSFINFLGKRKNSSNRGILSDQNCFF
jgi:hypothetical protein